MFLSAHPDQYHLSCCESFQSIGTLTGVTYARRHWELSNTDLSREQLLGHRTVAILEVIPVLGMLVALGERGLFTIKEHFYTVDSSERSPPLPREEVKYSNLNNEDEECEIIIETGPTDFIGSGSMDFEEDKAPSTNFSLQNYIEDECTSDANSPIAILEEPSNLPIEHKKWTPRQLKPEDSLRKMWKNSCKAIEEHRKTDPVTYATIEEALLPLDQLLHFEPKMPLHIRKILAGEAQGIREFMEDAHLIVNTNKAILVGVFDGHGGKAVAESAKAYFEMHFFSMLEENKDIYRTFEEIFHRFQMEIESRQELDEMGSTAVVSYIDKKTHLVYTATLGDSEANLYRQIGGEIKSIPLSPLRNWAHPKEAKRASWALQDERIAKTWPNAEKPKSLRFPVKPHILKVNLSRSFGDKALSYHNGIQGIIHKPKMTVNRMLSGDIFIMSCDGVKDFITEKQITQIVKYYGHEITPSVLVDIAIEGFSSQDNITVISLLAK